MPVKKSKIKRRLTSDERREAILEAALPLLAEVGFRGATTKALARRVGVSEALLYQHFPSKEALYSEVQAYLCRRYPALESVFSLLPSTESLVFFIFMLCQLILDPPEAFDTGKVMPRVMLQSILDDGVFARLHLERNMRPMIDVAAAAIGAARRSGDIPGNDGIPDDLRFIFAHHVIVMVHLGRLPSTPLFDYPKSKDKTIDHVVRFILRGVGLTDAAVAKFYDQTRLKATLMRELESGAKQGKRG